MTATLLELVIPASVSIVVACGTVIWTTQSNRRLEDIKLRNDKKESLFNSNQQLTIIVSKLNSFDMKYSVEIYRMAKELESSKDDEVKRIKLLTNLYFKFLDTDFDAAILEVQAIFEELKSEKTPGLDAFMSATKKLNELSDKILKI